MTLEQAFEAQKLVHQRIDAGEHIPNWRSMQLKPEYILHVPEYGFGLYPVHRETGEVCEWDGVWSPDETVLLCRGCYLDGT